MDKKYIILDTISNNSEVTQRELSRRTGLSLGSINLLLAKMAKEGLIKIKQIPMNRALYILTPKGMAEKIDKTYQYIKIHYNYINETKQKIVEVLNGFESTGAELTILLENDEINELIKSVLPKFPRIKVSYDYKEFDDKITIIVSNLEAYEKLNKEGRRVVNLLEKL